MKSIRIGNDIRIVWPIVLSGDVSKLKDLDLTVEVRLSKKVVDVRNYADSEINKVNSFKKTETTILMNGGVVCRPDNGSGKECCDVRPLYENPQTAPVKLPYTIENNTLIAIWPANKQFATGDYDIVLYGRKNKGGQTVCDQYRFVRLVSHTAQIDNEDNCGVEPVITMQPTTVELSGLSAYEVAVLEGFSGTREEWVESLKQPAKDAANEAEENFKTYQLETDKKVSEFVNRKVTPEMLSESTKQLIEASGGGTITNLADDEDIESVDDGTGTNVLKFKDRAYSPSTFSGKGYKILRKNIVDGKNLLTQDMINEENTRYIVQYDFDLNEETIKINNTSIIILDGGTFRNGIIECSNILGNYNTIYTPIVIDGSGYQNKGGLIENLNVDLQYNYDNAITIKNINYFVANNIKLFNFNKIGISIESATYEAMINNFECNTENRDISKYTIGIYVNATDNHFDNGLIKHCHAGLYSGNNNVYNNIHIWGSNPKTAIGIIASGVNKFNNIYFDGMTIVDNSKNQLDLLDDSVNYSYNGGIGCLFKSSGNVINNVTIVAKNIIDTTKYNIFATQGNAWNNIVNNLIVPDRFNTDKIVLFDDNNYKGRRPPYIHINNIYSTYGVFEDNYWFKEDIKLEQQLTASANQVAIIKEIGDKSLSNDTILDIDRVLGETNIDVNRVIYSKNGYTKIIRDLLNNEQLTETIDENFINLSKPIKHIGNIYNPISIEDDVDINTIINSGIYIGDASKLSNCPINTNNFILYVYSINDYVKIQHIIQIGEHNNYLHECYSLYRVLRIGDSITAGEWVTSNGICFDRQVGETGQRPWGAYIIKGYRFYDTSINKDIIFDGTIWRESDGNEAGIIRCGTTENRPNNLTSKNKGFQYFDTTLNKPIWWNGTRWVESYLPTSSSGNTASRPSNPTTGYQYFDTDLNKPIYWTGSKWVDATGADV